MTTTNIRIKIITSGIDFEEVAKEIGKAIDPDTGGEHSFIVEEEVNQLSASTYCNDNYYLSMVYLLNDPTQLFETVKLNAEKLGWESKTTIQDIFAFCNNTHIEVLKDEKGDI